MADIFDLFKKIEKKREGVTGTPEFMVVGLGNPGDKYAKTRHNVGFGAIEVLCKKYAVSCDRAKFHALCGEAVIDGKKVLLVMPQTFMNNSGEAVKAAADYYKIPPERIIVIYDDINFEPGVVRIREKGSDGGHNGMKSIISHLSSNNYPRIRVGVGKKPHPEYDLADWVLGEFKGEDREKLLSALDKVPDMVTLMVQGKFQEAMGRFNG